MLGQSFSLYGVTDFQVHYWTGTEWALVPGGTVAANTQVWRQLLFSPITTTAIRITVTGALDTWTRLTEVEAYTSAAASIGGSDLVGPTQPATTTNLTPNPALATVSGKSRRYD